MRGAAGSVATGAAAAVVKGMLFDQLRVALLTTSLCLTVVCCGLAMTGAPDTPPEKAAAPAADDPVAALVKLLGSADFAEREAAAKDLRELGIRAESALRTGLRSEDPEVRARATQLLAVIRKDALGTLVKTFDPAGEGEPDHPIWKRFKSIAGSDAPARRLFAEIIRDPRRLQVLDRAEADPDKTGDLYEQYVRQMRERVHSGMNRVNTFYLDHKRGARLWYGIGPDPDDPTPKPADAAVGFYLGTFPATAKALLHAQWEQCSPHLNGEETFLFYNAFSQGLDLHLPHRSTPADATTAPAFRRLFVAWLAGRRNPGSIAMGLAHAREIAEVLPTARAVAADFKNPVKLRIEAVPILGLYGEAKDERLIAALLEAETLIGQNNYGPAQKEAKMQARDLALATLLVMRGQDPAAFGFPGLEFHRVGPLETTLRSATYLGFYDDDSRRATHKKARAWLAEQKK
ncbi:HEAT repeat domain-containing protein [Frigoriglobus tundricola]|uniref:HEAT repeat domain-containing protein n=1 Tax=Frigoriglobus tundricola TaxID=2774151 RepID=A0A6M5YT40_9BACT|nr:hypothetical protein [Frigoriglobus tundricola]QJW97168.1 hypothetical protein FTUN_4733 [Frigoriglobus tundricola]